MTNRDSLGGRHHFAAQAEDAAIDLALALLAYGFAYVGVSPWQREWMVTVFDEGPYAADELGERTMTAVRKAAAAIARENGARSAGALVEYVEDVAEGIADADLLFRNPGARPPIPLLQPLPDPPPDALWELPADVVPPADALLPADELASLSDIDWPIVSHDDLDEIPGDVPTLFAALRREDEDWEWLLAELCYVHLLPHGTCYQATPLGMRHLARLAAPGTLPARRRLQLYEQIVRGAGTMTRQIVEQAFRAKNPDFHPAVAELGRRIHLAIDGEVPWLLARWDAEPPATRYLLAVLAALYPHHGHHLRDHIGTMAADVPGTRQSAYLLLAEAVLRDDEERTAALVAEISAWARLELDDIGLTPQLTAVFILTDCRK
ncbi:hypothetical protein ACFYV7_10870 [Nocardia suismassiliense]|uniref:DUF4192 domain-containing protein n=1 Tax=Nocardia suismassiliense TaxID=2077092 RepID=A0ABW6QPY9_9NOCA